MPDERARRASPRLARPEGRAGWDRLSAALGQTLSLQAVTCPVCLLAGRSDDITTLVGTPSAQNRRKLVPGGHIGLFMGTRTLQDASPEIASRIAEADRAAPEGSATS